MFIKSRVSYNDVTAINNSATVKLFLDDHSASIGYQPTV